jgi:integrase
LPLTDAAIRGIKPPEKGQKDYTDQHGLVLRVSQGGSKSWVFRHGATGSRITIGKYPSISLAAARQRSRELGAEITLGKHRPKSLTYTDAFDLFIENHLKAKNRPSSAAETERLLRKPLLRFGRRSLSEITTHEIAAFLDGMSPTPSEANHCYVSLKTFFNFAFRRGYIDASPIARLQKPYKDRARRRVLTAAELRSVLGTAREIGNTYSRLLRLLIYSGQRLAQIQTLTDAHVDRNARTFSWSADEMKHADDHLIPYHNLTAALLEELPTEGWLFPGQDDPTKHFNNLADPHAALLKASGVAHFTRHDCRRVYSSIHAQIGTPPHIAERLLAHKNGAASGGMIGRTYNRYRYAAEMRQACTAYEQFLSDLVAGNLRPSRWLVLELRDGQDCYVLRTQTARYWVFEDTHTPDQRPEIEVVSRVPLSRRNQSLPDRVVAFGTSSLASVS